jgi:putative nucleotidyltransferase with HDIG domain
MVIDAEALVIRKRLEQSLKELPPLPTAISKVLDETNKAEPDLHRIDEIISGDQALASKVLRIVNSAYYGLSRQVTSVGQAVMILGLQQVRTITLSVGSIAAFSNKGPIDAEGSRRFWEHSFATSAACSILGRKLNFDRKTQEMMSTIGILHDIGRMFFFCNFKPTYEKLIGKAIKEGKSYEEAETNFLGETHAGIGAMIAEKWGLPEEIVQTIKEHEGPYTTETNQWVAVLAVADWMNKSLYYASEETTPKIEFDPVLFQVLGLSEEVVHQITEEVRKRVSEASQLYGMVA